MYYYKAFNEDMTCLGYQFEVGKTYSIKGELKMCENGFHCCEDIINCLSYYPKTQGSRYCEIEINDEHMSEGIKTVARTINIIREITGDELLKALTGKATLIYPNGTPYSTTEYKGGIMDGIKTEYFENGKVAMISSYKDGKRVGLQREWYRNGQQKLEYSYMQSKYACNYVGFVRSWYDDGQVSSISFYDDTGKRKGDYITYHDNGQVMWHENDSKEVVKYYPDGVLMSKSCYIEDDLIKYTEYDPLGHIYREYFRKDGSLTRTYTQYSSSGEIIKLVNYDK